MATGISVYPPPATDANVAAIKAVTDLLPNGGALTGIAAIKAVTDLLPNAGALTSLATQAAVTALGTTTRLGSINAKITGTVTILDNATTGTATHSAVVLARSVLTSLGFRVSVAVTFITAMTELAQTNTTTVTATRQTASGAGAVSDIVVQYQIVEYTA